MADSELTNAERWEVEQAAQQELDRIERSAGKDGRSWWQANKRWTVALLPAIAAVIAASSFRYFHVYQPNTFSEAVSVAAGETAHFDREFVTEEHTFWRAAEVEVFAVQKLEEIDFPDFQPTADVELWAVATSWKAQPDVTLSWCETWLTDTNGTSYGNYSELIGDKNFDKNFSSMYACVPPEATGPDAPSIFDPDPQEDPDNKRPETWRKVNVFALPPGVTPKTLQIGWEKPFYLQLELPEPGTDIVPKN